jgi:cytochrome c-type biogenesis protein CcmH/NrfG
MTARIPKQNKGGSKPPRSNMSVLTIAFAIAMAFFLVIGMVAVGVTEFVGGSSNEQVAQDDFAQTIEEEGEDEEAELRNRIEEDPDDYNAHSQLAVLLGNTGRVDEAIPHYETALQGEPDDTPLRLSFARSLEQHGYDLDAEIQLQRVLDEDDENVEAMYLLAGIKERSEPPQLEEAEQLYEQVIETDPESFYAQMAEERLAAADEAGDQSRDDDDSQSDDAD